MQVRFGKSIKRRNRLTFISDICADAIVGLDVYFQNGKNGITAIIANSVGLCFYSKDSEQKNRAFCPALSFNGLFPVIFNFFFDDIHVPFRFGYIMVNGVNISLCDFQFASFSGVEGLSKAGA